MFQTYEMIGRKFKIGNVSALGLMIFSFFLFGSLGGWWILSEIDWINRVPGWIKLTSANGIGLLGQWVMGRFLYRPLPRQHFPMEQAVVGEDLGARLLAGLPFQQLGGFRRKGFLERKK